MVRRMLSSRTAISTTTNGVNDASGNAVISSDNTYGGSPLGKAAFNQVVYGLPNADFSILPPNLSEPIDDNTNPLPYWSLAESNNDAMSASIEMDTTNRTYVLRMTPGTAVTGDYLIMRTRLPITTDPYANISQQIVANATRVGGTAAFTQTQYSIHANYYDAQGVLLDTTSALSSFSDTGSSQKNIQAQAQSTTYVNSSAAYIEMDLRMDAVANISVANTMDFNTVFLLTTTGGIVKYSDIYAKGDILVGTAKGAGSWMAAGTNGYVLTAESTAVYGVMWKPAGSASAPYLQVDTFTSSTVWNVPANTDQLEALLVLGAGGGGGGGSGTLRTSTETRYGGSGGGGGGLFYKENVWLANATAVTITIGSGGPGGAGGQATKAVGGTAQVTVAGDVGFHGGATTFGSFGSAQGGRRGAGGPTNSAQPAGGAAGQQGNGQWYGDALNDQSGINQAVYYRENQGNGGAGGQGGAAAPGNSLYAESNPVRDLQLPYNASVGISAGSAGGTASSTGGGTLTTSAGAAGGRGGYWGGGGGGGGAVITTVQTAGSALVGGGGGGGAGRLQATAIGTYTVTGGEGGAANQPDWLGGGGGGGGGAAFFYNTTAAQYNSTVATATGGDGGAGGDGMVVIAYMVYP